GGGFGFWWQVRRQSHGEPSLVMLWSKASDRPPGPHLVALSSIEAPNQVSPWGRTRFARRTRFDRPNPRTRLRGRTRWCPEPDSTPPRVQPPATPSNRVRPQPGSTQPGSTPTPTNRENPMPDPRVRIAAVGDLHCRKTSAGTLQPLFANLEHR